MQLEEERLVLEGQTRVPGARLTLSAEVQKPCRLVEVNARWCKLEEIVIRGRFGIMGPESWHTGWVIQPGWCIDVRVQPADVGTECQVVLVLMVPATTSTQRSALEAVENNARKQRDLRGYIVQANRSRGRRSYLEQIEKPDEEPDRFGELDFDDDQES